MEFYYGNELNTQYIVALLKAHGIKRIIVSPGGTDSCLAASLQHDRFFEMYSCIDERSAAYMACGMAAESGERIVIICTESTASREHLPGLTEAFHRKLPILEITGMHKYSLIGHLEPQCIDRTVSPLDCFRLQENLPILKDDDDKWESQIRINNAILELTRHGGCPVRINMPLPNPSYDFTTKELPNVNVIRRYYSLDQLPELPAAKTVVFVGSHKPWSEELTKAVDLFCAQHDAVVFCGHASKYYGKYAFHPNLLSLQKYDWEVLSDIETVIHIGEEPADQATMNKLRKAKHTWRVSEDGELRDPFRNLENVFEMREIDFFNYYCDKTSNVSKRNYLQKCNDSYNSVMMSIPQLPFSNVFMAYKMMPHIPNDSIVHFGVSNTIRAWSMFNLPTSVHSDSNVGCRGIDGALSSSIGISLINSDKICFCVLGDLTFFYDMNALGNRHIGNNYRVLLINNGGGNIFKQPGTMGHRIGDNNANLFIAAGGHYGGKESGVVKGFVEPLGFKYLVAHTCEEFEDALKIFLNPEIDMPILLEAITEDENERKAFDLVSHCVLNSKGQIIQSAKKILGERGTDFFRGRLSKK